MSNSSALGRAQRSVEPRAAVLALGASLVAAAGLVALGAASASASPAPSSFVYTETNQVKGNDVLAYSAAPDGSLALIGSFPTGGTGTGSSPGSQGGVSLGDGGHLLAAVNGGSNSVSVFAVEPWGALQLLQTNSSGGVGPISVTISGGWVYALNEGSNNIGGFPLGVPSHFPDIVQPLHPGASSPEQVSFTPDGRDLVVTEKSSNTIDVFPVHGPGIAGPAVTTALASAPGPYGFGFTPEGTAVVSEAAFGGLATFSVNPDGTLTQISQLGDGQEAACWVALSANGQEAFTANAHSGNVSAYTVAPNGTLSLLLPNPQTSPGGTDTDLAVAGNSTLYISDQPNFDSSAISPSGDLGPSVVAASGLPVGTFGLAATGASA